MEVALWGMAKNLTLNVGLRSATVPPWKITQDKINIVNIFKYFLLESNFLLIFYHIKIKKHRMTLKRAFCPLIHCMIILGKHLKPESCNTQRVWNRPRLFSPTFIKIDVTFESDNKIKLFKMLLLANTTALSIKKRLWSYYFDFLWNIADKNV